MKKNASAISVIGGDDGPTSVFIAKKDTKKITIRQKIQRLKHRIKKFYVEKTITSENHSMDEVMEYIVNKYGFVEAKHDSAEIAEEYRQMRASFLIQYAPELLGEYAAFPSLRSESAEDIQAYIKKCDEQMERANEIPQTVFDIDFHKFKKVFADINDHMDISIEKNYAYIGGGACGSKKLIRQYERIYKDVYRYYGVTEEDIKNKSKRYQDLVRTLSL